MSKKRTCPRCGFGLDNDVTTCPSCGCQVPIVEEKRHCPKCKQELDGTADFCPNCGAKVKRKLESTNQKIIRLIISIGVPIIVAVLAMLWSNFVWDFLG